MKKYSNIQVKLQAIVIDTTVQCYFGHGDHSWRGLMTGVLREICHSPHL